MSGPVTPRRRSLRSFARTHDSSMPLLDAENVMPTCEASDPRARTASTTKPMSSKTRTPRTVSRYADENCAPGLSTPRLALSGKGQRGSKSQRTTKSISATSDSTAVNACSTTTNTSTLSQSAKSSTRRRPVFQVLTVDRAQLAAAAAAAATAGTHDSDRSMLPLVQPDPQEDDQSTAAAIDARQPEPQPEASEATTRHFVDALVKQSLETDSDDHSAANDTAPSAPCSPIQSTESDTTLFAEPDHLRLMQENSPAQHRSSSSQQDESPDHSVASPTLSASSPAEKQHAAEDQYREPDCHPVDEPIASQAHTSYASTDAAESDEPVPCDSTASAACVQSSCSQAEPAAQATDESNDAGADDDADCQVSVVSEFASMMKRQNSPWKTARHPQSADDYKQIAQLLREAHEAQERFTARLSSLGASSHALVHPKSGRCYMPSFTPYNSPAPASRDVQAEQDVDSDAIAAASPVSSITEDQSVLSECDESYVQIAASPRRRCSRLTSVVTSAAFFCVLVVALSLALSNFAAAS